jgi:hypothetical protein
MRGKYIMKEMKLTVSSRPFSRLVVVGACLAAAMTFVANNSLAVGPLLTYSASAYGTYAFVGGTIVAGKTAPVSVGGGCGTFIVPQSKDGTVVTVNVPPLITNGLVDTNAASVVNRATGTSHVHEAIVNVPISLLGGLITAQEINAVSTTFKDATGFHSNGNDSSLVNLVIAGGNPINVVPAKNTTIQLAGFGKVVLNEQFETGTATSTNKQLIVNMLHVYITIANNLGIPVGTQIIVADAVSGLRQIGGPGSLDGTAFGTQVSGTVVKSSQTAPVSVQCSGNSLKVAESLGIHVILPPSYHVLDSGTIHDTAQGSITPTLSSSHTTSDIQSVDVLNGTILATVIHAQADASTTDGSTFTFSTAGSSFASLTVAGFPAIDANVPKNTKLTLAGIGTLWLRKETKSANNIEMKMIELTLTQVFNGLPIGTKIVVGYASASLHSPQHP